MSQARCPSNGCGLHEDLQQAPVGRGRDSGLRPRAADKGCVRSEVILEHQDVLLDLVIPSVDPKRIGSGPNMAQQVVPGCCSKPRKALHREGLLEPIGEASTAGEAATVDKYWRPAQNTRHPLRYRDHILGFPTWGPRSILFIRARAPSSWKSRVAIARP